MRGSLLWTPGTTHPNGVKIGRRSGVNVQSRLTDTLIRRDPTAASRRRETTIEPLPPSDRKILRALVERLEDPIILGDFDLTNDGRKIRLAGPPGTWLIEPEELQLLRTLAGRPAGQ